MPLKLIEPDKRKGNKYYLILGMEAGTQYEVSTRTTDKKLAQRRLVELKQKLAEAAPPSGRNITFAHAAELYRTFARLQPEEVKRLDKVVDELGRRRVADLTHADLVAGATRAFPGRASSSLNRNFMDVAAAVLHYAATNGYCGWLRVEKFKQPRAAPRAARPEAVARLLDAVKGKRWLLLLWLHYQGTRITQTLSIEWERVDLKRAAFSFYDRKARMWQELPLHEEVLEELKLVPETERVGRVFPWGDRHNVYRWLRPLTEELGVTFTPHMARHALSTRLNDDGAGLRKIMGALGHLDPRSSMRYQNPNLEVVRAASAKPPRLRSLRDGTPRPKISGTRGVTS